VRPFHSEYENFKELANEMFILCCSYMFMCFSDFVPDLHVRLQLGYFVCFLVLSNFVLNIAAMLGASIHGAKMDFRRYRFRKASSKALAASKAQWNLELGKAVVRNRRFNQ